MVTYFHPPLPVFPAVSTAPLQAADRSQLFQAIRECKAQRSGRAARAHLTQGYALLWLHLALERGLDPRRVLAPSSAGYDPLLKAFLQVGVTLGVDDRTTLGWEAPLAALRACRLWTEAKDRQTVKPAQLPGLLEGQP